VAPIPVDLSKYRPTAMHAFREGHASRFSSPPDVPDRFGVERRTHRVPFQDTANGAMEWDAVAWAPTAMHAVREGHDTASRKLSVVPGWFGLG